ncbi:MAG: D-lyxose/D-mannose family sugar isomerase [Candidatus Aminicenantales bacterium]|jgi:D-lyxose ketol-isomerase
MTDDVHVNEAKRQAADLIRKSGFPLTEEEWQELQIDDFGLGHLFEEGFAFIDILRSPQLRVTILVLLPGQTLPQHLHPAYDQEPGKEETLRVLYGSTNVYIEGEPSNPRIHIPSGKTPHYTARQEIALTIGRHFTIPPMKEHWFQGGPQGSVNICFQNRVDETHNVFFDPRSSGCPIIPKDRHGAKRPVRNKKEDEK